MVFNIGEVAQVIASRIVEKVETDFGQMFDGESFSYDFEGFVESQLEEMYEDLPETVYLDLFDAVITNPEVVMAIELAPTLAEDLAKDAALFERDKMAYYGVNQSDFL